MYTMCLCIREHILEHIYVHKRTHTETDTWTRTCTTNSCTCTIRCWTLFSEIGLWIWMWEVWTRQLVQTLSKIYPHLFGSF